MSDTFKEFAVYWVPDCEDPLARFGLSWTGWCAEHGKSFAGRQLHGVSFDVEAITRTVCRHGLHAVIEAPFRLGAQRSRFALEHVLAVLAETVVGFPLPPLRLAVIGGRVSLMPGPNCTKAAELVTQIHDALAPLGAGAQPHGFAEAAPAAYVADGTGPIVQLPTRAAHDFHMPLTDPLEVHTAFAVLRELEPLLRPVLNEPRRVSDLALMGDPGAGRRVSLLQRYQLREVPLRPAIRALPCIGPDLLAPVLSRPQHEPSDWQEVLGVTA